MYYMLNAEHVDLLSGTGHEDVLKTVKLPIVSNQKCRENHRGSLQIGDNKMCAGGRKDEGVCEVSLPQVWV